MNGARNGCDYDPVYDGARRAPVMGRRDLRADAGGLSARPGRRDCAAHDLVDCPRIRRDGPVPGTATMTGHNNEHSTDENNRRVVDVMVVVERILEHCDGKPGVGRIPCPICRTGIVGYSIPRKRAAAAPCATA